MGTGKPYLRLNWRLLCSAPQKEASRGSPDVVGALMERVMRSLARSPAPALEPWRWRGPVGSGLAYNAQLWMRPHHEVDHWFKPCGCWCLQEIHHRVSWAARNAMVRAFLAAGEALRFLRPLRGVRAFAAQPIKCKAKGDGRNMGCFPRGDVRSPYRSVPRASFQGYPSHQLTWVCAKRPFPRGKSSFYRGLCTSPR